MLLVFVAGQKSLRDLALRGPSYGHFSKSPLCGPEDLFRPAVWRPDNASARDTDVRPESLVLVRERPGMSGFSRGSIQQMIHDALRTTEIRAFQLIECFPEVQQTALGREVEDA